MTIVMLMLLLGTAQRTPDAVIAWAESTAAALGGFLPRSVEGLVDTLPWDVERDYPEFNSGCPIGCLQFAPAQALRGWRVADPDLVARHEAATSKAEADAGAIAAAAGSLSPDELERRTRAITDSTESLERRGRSVELIIRANVPPAPAGPEGAPTASAPIQGLPVLRYTFDDPAYAPASRGIRLLVTLGPPGFTNPAVRAELMKSGVRLITVSASVQTLPATAAADEALLRRLLDAVDYEGLKKLLE